MDAFGAVQSAIDLFSRWGETWPHKRRRKATCPASRSTKRVNSAKASLKNGARSRHLTQMGSSTVPGEVNLAGVLNVSAFASATHAVPAPAHAFGVAVSRVPKIHRLLSNPSPAAMDHRKHSRPGFQLRPYKLSYDTSPKICTDDTAPKSSRFSAHLLLLCAHSNLFSHQLNKNND